MSRRFYHAFRDWFYTFLYFIATFLFGWATEKYQELNKFYVRQKENVQSIYHRSIYKELRFFHS